MRGMSILSLCCALAFGQGTKTQSPGWMDGYSAGEQAARQDFRRYRAATGGVLAGGASAGAGAALGAVPRVDSPGCAVVGCGAVGLASAAWAWDLLPMEPPALPPDTPSDYAEGYTLGYQDELLTLRRKWSLISGGLTVLAVGGTWALGSRLLGWGG